jgi:hypothetical protein
MKVYVLTFIITSFLWWRHRLFARRMAYQGMIEEEVRAVELARK